MKLILELRDEDAGEKSKKKEARKRTAARAVLIKKDKIALLNVTKQGYRKLPGGGVEKDETIEEALAREILEETGCTMKVLGEVGEIIEHRNRHGLVQTSFCYIGEVIKEGEPEFDEGEQSAGYRLEWTDINSAIKIISKEKPKNYEGKFIVKRDIAFLKAAMPGLK